MGRNDGNIFGARPRTAPAWADRPGEYSKYSERTTQAEDYSVKGFLFTNLEGFNVEQIFRKTHLWSSLSPEWGRNAGHMSDARPKTAPDWGDRPCK